MATVEAWCCLVHAAHTISSSRDYRWRSSRLVVHLQCRRLLYRLRHRLPPLEAVRHRSRYPATTPQLMLGCLPCSALHQHPPLPRPPSACTATSPSQRLGPRVRACLTASTSRSSAAGRWCRRCTLVLSRGAAAHSCTTTSTTRSSSQVGGVQISGARACWRVAGLVVVAVSCCLCATGVVHVCLSTPRACCHAAAEHACIHRSRGLRLPSFIQRINPPPPPHHRQYATAAIMSIPRRFLVSQGPHGVHPAVGDEPRRGRSHGRRQQRCKRCRCWW